MNRRGRLSLNIQAKLFIIFLIITFVPFIVLGMFAYSGTRQFSLENLEAYVSESGARRDQAIENSFQTALSTINAFMDNPASRDVIIEPLVIRQQTGSGSAGSSEIQVEDLFTHQLISTGLVNSVWLLGVDASPFIAAIGPDQSQPRIRNLQSISQTEILSVGRQLSEIGENTQALVTVQLDDRGQSSQHILVLDLLFGEVSEGRIQHVGYLVVELNLDAIIVSNLPSESGELETYSYVIMPGSRDYLTDARTAERQLVDMTSKGAQLILKNAVSQVSTYTAGSGETRREVVGYYAPIQVENERFALIVELDTTIVQDQLRDAVTAIGFPLVSGVGIMMVIVLALTNQMIMPPLAQLREAMQDVARGNFTTPLASTQRHDEIGLLSTTFVDMREQIRHLTDDMEQRLRARVRDVRITQDISRTVTAERDLDRLMQRVVDLIVENFPSIYHAQIFMLDSAREFAVLRASTGEAGRALLQRGHKMAVGSLSVIGQVTEQGQVVIARDTAESAVHRHNEFLRHTLAELAIPLRLGNIIIGVLDVQSQQRDSFDEDLVAALQTLADQVTIAIENARLYEESARLLSDLERDRQATTRFAWQQYMSAARTSRLTRSAGIATDYDFTELNVAVYRSGTTIVGQRTERNTVPFSVPIVLRGRILGVIEYELPEDEFNQEKVLLAEELVSRLAISLDNARLFQDSKQATERERVVNEISAQLTGQTDIEDIIHTAIHEVGLALRTKQIAVRLRHDTDNHTNGRGNGHEPDHELAPDNPPDTEG